METENRRGIAAAVLTIVFVLVSLTGNSIVYADNSSTERTRLNIWTIETVDSEGAVGTYSSQVIGTEGGAHIAYLDSTNGKLRYAVLNNSIWNITTVGNSVNVFCGISLGLDSSKNPHISYIDWSYDLYYAHRTGISWSVEYVTSIGPPSGTGEDSSIAIDSSDNPHILFLRTDTGEAVYASKSMGSWSFETVEKAGNGHWVSLEMDSSDTPHASYTQTTLKDLKYATRIGAVWTNETVDFIGDVGYMASLCLNLSDQPRIAYLDLGNKHLKFAAKVNGSWLVETVDSSSPTGWYSSVDINLLDRPGIAYESEAGGNLMYAYNSSGTWEIETVDFDGVVGWMTSLVFDSQGRPAISYYDNTRADLKYAIGSPVSLPDLYVDPSDLSSAPSTPVANGTLVTLEARIHNIGSDNATNVLVRFYDGDVIPENQIDADQILTILSVGANSTVSVSWTPTDVGEHIITVIVDPRNSIEESNEGNNMASFIITVLSPFSSSPKNLRAVLSGPRLWNVTLYWNLSIDDGSGEDCVIRYDILRNESYDPELRGYNLHDSVPSGVASIIDSFAGEGDPKNYFYSVCSVNVFGNRSCLQGQVGKFTRNLGPGPRLVSIPLVLEDSSISTGLQTLSFDSAWQYDASDNSWLIYHRFKSYSTTFALNHTVGVWINVTDSSNLTVAGKIPLASDIILSEGWNLIGFPSWNASYSVAELMNRANVRKVEGFDETQFPFRLSRLCGSDILSTGFGYWAYIDSPTTWRVEF